ncbi:transposase-like protein [Devosia sp. UYZn731]
MERRKFSREFKLEAVRLVRERGVAVAQAAHDLGLHVNVLRKWVREQSADPQPMAMQILGLLSVQVLGTHLRLQVIDRSIVTLQKTVAVARRLSTIPRLLAFLARKPARVASVAMANKMARVVWAVMARGEVY